MEARNRIIGGITRYWRSLLVHKQLLPVLDVGSLSICSPDSAAMQAESRRLPARVKRIEANAKMSLKPGTKKADVTAFFASEKIPMGFYKMAGQNEASGQIFVTGLTECASVACGDDSALIGVRVDVDENGTVVSDPVVVGMYTDCL